MMNARMLRTHCPLDAAAATAARTGDGVPRLSARAYDRIVKVARTIADLAGAERIAAAHVAEAINYRSLDRELGSVAGRPAAGVRRNDARRGCPPVAAAGTALFRGPADGLADAIRNLRKTR